MVALARTATIVLCVTLGAFSAGCGSEKEEDAEWVPTESSCPNQSTLTYESFGRAFMESYCTRCHSSTRTGFARSGAPTGHDFDTLSGILLVAEHIDQHAAAGPAGKNTEMPPTDPKPSDEERRQLGGWLACERLRQ